MKEGIIEFFNIRNNPIENKSITFDFITDLRLKRRKYKHQIGENIFLDNKEQ